MACGAPNPALGTAQRYSDWFDCNARVLGHDGFLGLAGYVIDNGILAGLLTIFIALIGYRLLLGGRVQLSDGVGWALKIGIVLALLGGWTAFQSVFYDLAIEAPRTIASETLVASGIPTDDTGMRFQRVYDALRLGVQGSFETDPADSAVRAQPALPITSITFLTVTVGTVGIVKLLTGFLLALAPLPIALLIFGPGMGVFIGWLRALAASIISTAGLTVNAFLCLLALESEVSRMQSLGLAGPGTMDEQAPAAVAAIFFLFSLLILAFSLSLARGLAERLWHWDGLGQAETISDSGALNKQVEFQRLRDGGASLMRVATTQEPVLERSTKLANAFERSAATSSGSSSWPRNGREEEGELLVSLRSTRTQSSGRRALGRRHRSSVKRDRAI